MFALPVSVHQASTVLFHGVWKAPLMCIELVWIVQSCFVLRCLPSLFKHWKENPAPLWQQVPPAQTQHHRAGPNTGEGASVRVQRQDHLATSIVTGALSPAVCCFTQHASVCLVPGLSGKTVTKAKHVCVCVCVKNPVLLTLKKISQIRLDSWEHTLLSASQRPPCSEACCPSQDRDASIASAAVIIIMVSCL